MKKLVWLLALGLWFLSACSKEEGITAITEQERADLLFLAEEEKLARDVYLFSYDTHNQQIFNNISSSEQSHMNSVFGLLDKYEIPNPVIDNPVGFFIDSNLQALYFQLIAQATASVNDALEVGALIEDLDIHDISTLEANTSKSDILNVYSKLTCGSRNHLRSFVAQLGSYSPTYLGATEYQQIINSPHEQCGN